MAPPAPMPCPVPGCGHLTPAGLPSFELIYNDLNLHTKYVHADAPANPIPNPNPVQPKPKELPRPELDEGITESDWQHFVEKWTRYKRSCLSTATETIVQDQLRACCTDQLEKSLYNSGISATATEADLLKSMKELSVRKQNILVNVVQFLRMGQDSSETAGSFTARLKGQARVCNFTLPEGVTDYSDKMVTHQLIRGLVDPVIQEQVLAHSSTNKDMTLDAVLQFVQAKEAGKQDSSHLTEAGGGLCRISDFQRSKSSRNNNTPLPPNPNPPVGKIRKMEDKCAWCGQTGHGALVTEDERKQKCPAFGKICKICSKANHLDSVCKSKKKPGNTNLLTSSTQGIGPFCCISTSKGPVTLLSHHVYNKFSGWAASRPEEHPTMNVSCSIATTAYTDLSLPTPRVTDRTASTPALADTGAQMCVAGPSFLHALGATKKELIKLQNGVSTANNAGLTLLGGLFSNIMGTTPTGETFNTQQLVYIAEGINTLFLSKSACRDLGIIGEHFPEVGSFRVAQNLLQGLHSLKETQSEASEERENSKQCKPYGPQDSLCHCPRRTATPEPPTLPFKPTEDNLPKLKEFILNYYKSSAFNQCETQPLPLLQDSPPLRLYIDPDAKPVACHKPRPVPLHWQEKVKEGLDRDCRIGVMEKVPVGTPSTWCAPMVLVAKQDGEPRRTVDFQKVNDHSVRQTHPTTAPYLQAASLRTPRRVS